MYLRMLAFMSVISALLPIASADLIWDNGDPMLYGWINIEKATADREASGITNIVADDFRLDSRAAINQVDFVGAVWKKLSPAVRSVTVTVYARNDRSLPGDKYASVTMAADDPRLSIVIDDTRTETPEATRDALFAKFGVGSVKGYLVHVSMVNTEPLFVLPASERWFVSVSVDIDGAFVWLASGEASSPSDPRFYVYSPTPEKDKDGHLTGTMKPRWVPNRSGGEKGNFNLSFKLYGELLP